MIKETFVYFTLKGVCSYRPIEYTWDDDEHKRIKSLHENFNCQFKSHKVLDISRDSTESLGLALSEDYLRDSKGRLVADVFGSGRIQFKNNKIVGLKIEEREFPSDPWTLPKYWLWCKAVYDQKVLLERLLKYDAFSDIHFTPPKYTFGTNAEAAALLVTTHKLGYLDGVMQNIETFARGCYGIEI